jgi:hypothetical protein
MAETLGGGYPLTEPERCTQCTAHNPGTVTGLVGPLCGFVAGLAAALAAVLMVMIVDPPGTELRVPPPADPLGCDAGSWADHGQWAPRTPGSSAPAPSVSVTKP